MTSPNPGTTSLAEHARMGSSEAATRSLRDVPAGFINEKDIDLGDVDHGVNWDSVSDANENDMTPSSTCAPKPHHKASTPEPVQMHVVDRPREPSNLSARRQDDSSPNYFLPRIFDDDDGKHQDEDFQYFSHSHDTMSSPFLQQEEFLAKQPQFQIPEEVGSPVESVKRTLGLLTFKK